MVSYQISKSLIITSFKQKKTKSKDVPTNFLFHLCIVYFNQSKPIYLIESVVGIKHPGLLIRIIIDRSISLNSLSANLNWNIFFCVIVYLSFILQTEQFRPKDLFKISTTCLNMKKQSLLIFYKKTPAWLNR